MLRYMRVDLVILLFSRLLLTQIFFFSLYMLTSVEQCSYRMGGRVCRLIRSGSNPNLLLMCVEFLLTLAFSLCVCACCPSGRASCPNLSSMSLWSLCFGLVGAVLPSLASEPQQRRVDPSVCVHTSCVLMDVCIFFLPPFHL